MKRWLRLALPFAAVLTLVTITVTIHVRQQADPTDPAYLSPISDAGIGSASLAAQLSRRGIAVDRRTTTPDALAAAASPDATLFVTAPGLIHPDYLRLVGAVPAARVVLVAPAAAVLERIGLAVGVSGPRWTAAAPASGCVEDFGAHRAAVLRYSYGDGGGASRRCFRGGVLELAHGSSEVTVVGAADPFRNDRLAEHDNAALAITLLTGTGRVVWLDLHQNEPPPTVTSGTGPTAPPEAARPEPATGDEQDRDGEPGEESNGEPGDGDTDEQGQQEQPGRQENDQQRQDDGNPVTDSPLAKAFPPAVWATLLLLVLAAIALAGASARRLGAPVAEPLPVRVRAAETVRGLGGLYRRSRARDASLATVQAAAQRRLAEHFGLAPDSALDDVAEHVSAYTGQPVHEVRALLGGGVEDNDASLAAKATAVQDLVRHITVGQEESVA
jgi:uncharacterized protein DUF4350